MRRILIALAALALAACATPQKPEPLPAGPALAFAGGFGTLATVDTCEYAIAPLYTRNAAARSKAAADLRAERIDINRARAVLAATDAVRAELDRACPMGRTGKAVDAVSVARAQALLLEIGR